MKTKTNLISLLAVLGFLIINIVSCSSGNAVNDFFGIQMDPMDEADFIIISYSDINGVTYKNSSNMNPKFNAWAEIGVEEITFKIINNSDQPLILDYFSDTFVIITDEDDFIVDKGDQIDYFKVDKIEPKSSSEISLNIPSDFASDFLKREGAILNKDIMGDFSKNWSQNSILKENIKYILIKFSDVVFLLKKVPEQA